MALAVRTHEDPKLLTARVVEAIYEVNPEQPLFNIRTMDEVVDRSLAPQWLNTALLTIFATVSLVLATVGVYGVLSYSTGLRAREIGIRMALGSQKREVIWMVLRRGIFLAGLGTSLGIAGALLLRRVLSTLLFGIPATDVVSFLSASIVLICVALAASYLPARRAASVDPSSLLRTE
jgi:putative ABC transport system permease protein